MNTKLCSSRQEFSIVTVSSAGAASSTSTALLPQQNYILEPPTGVACHLAATSVALHDSLEEEDSSQSLSDSLNCGVIRRGAKKGRGLISDFSDSIEDSSEDTDDTTVDSDTSSFYSVDSRLTPIGHESELSLPDTEYFSESTLYNSALSLRTPRPSSHSSYLSITSTDTTDGVHIQPSYQRDISTYQNDFSDSRQESDISLDYTSCPDLSPIGFRHRRGQYVSSRLSPIQASHPVSYRNNHPTARFSHSRRNKTISTSSMSAVEDIPSSKVGEELETKKKKGLMSSFRKSRKTSRKLRQQKKAAADGDTTSTGTGVTSDGEQDLLIDSEPSAPNSPAPVKNVIEKPEANNVENAVEKPEEMVLDNHEQLNGTASPKESSHPNSNESSPLLSKKISDKKSEEKEEKKGRGRFGGSIFRKKKAEPASTAPLTTDTNADVIASDTPEVKDEEKEDGLKADTEPPTADDAEPAQTIEAVVTEEPKPIESKPSSFRSYISSVQFVKNWTVSSESPKAQQTSEAETKTTLDPDAVDVEKPALDGTDTAPATTTIETKKVTTSTIGKPSATEVTSKKKTTVTIVTTQSPKLRNSPTTVVRRAQALASPPSPSGGLPAKVTFKAATVNTLPPNLSKKWESPTPVLPKRLSLEIMTPPATDSTQPSWGNSGTASSKHQHPPPLSITSPEGETKHADMLPANENQHPQKVSMDESQQPKRVTGNEPKKVLVIEPNKALVNEPQKPQKISVNEPQCKKIPTNEPQQPKKVPVNDPQPRKVPVTEPQPKMVPSNDPPTKKVLVTESQTPVKTENKPYPPKKVLISDDAPPPQQPQQQQQPRKVPVNTTGTNEAADPPIPVPFPVSTTPAMATPPSSPEGHPGRDARETPEGDRTENERNSLVESSSLTDSWAGASTDKREHLYKILVIGELGTGKTSIIKRYVHQFFSQHYRATIGVDFALKVLNWDNNTVIRLQLWDIAGQERFGNMTRVYYKEAVGAFVVFDVTRAQTFDAVTKWKTDLDTKVTLADGSPIPTVLLANKCDQPKEGVVNNPARMDDYCRERGFSGWFETSAKENINIDEGSRFLVNKILSNEKQGMMMTESLDTDKFSVDGKANPVDKSGCRC